MYATRTEHGIRVVDNFVLNAGMEAGMTKNCAFGLGDSRDAVVAQAIADKPPCSRGPFGSRAMCDNGQKGSGESGIMHMGVLFLSPPPLVENT